MKRHDLMALALAGTLTFSLLAGCNQTEAREDSGNEVGETQAQSNGGDSTGALTSFLDRVFYADLNSGGNRFRLKPAAAVVSARRAGTTAAWDQLNKYFGLMQMPIVTSQYWNMVHGTTPAEVRQDLEGLQTMRTLGKNMAFLLQCKRIALENGLKLPEQEPAIRTNFVGGAPLP